MQNQTDNGFNNNLVDRTFANSAIPDPAEWVNEHHFLANFAHQLSHLQQNFSDGGWEIGDNGEPSESQLAIDIKIREILKASFSDDYWQYVEGLF